jgi:hypothetical protein
VLLIKQVPWCYTDFVTGTFCNDYLLSQGFQKYIDSEDKMGQKYEAKCGLQRRLVSNHRFELNFSLQTRLTTLLGRNLLQI